MTIARGGALATLTISTVDAFMSRGAAFGIQRRKRPSTACKREGVTMDWENTAYFLLDKVRPAAARSSRFLGSLAQLTGSGGDVNRTTRRE
jgi:hypothetical protein